MIALKLNLQICFIIFIDLLANPIDASIYLNIYISFPEGPILPFLEILLPVGLNPNTPVIEAGIRTLPAVSLITANFDCSNSYKCTISTATTTY